MHELSLANAMIEQIEEIINDKNVSRVDSITVSIGALSGVEKDAFEFVFPMAIEDTFLHGSKLIIETVKLKIRCNDCNAEVEPEVPLMHCHKCGSHNIVIIQGQEFMLKSLEVS